MYSLNPWKSIMKPKRFISYILGVCSFSNQKHLQPSMLVSRGVYIYIYTPFWTLTKCLLTPFFLFSTKLRSTLLRSEKMWILQAQLIQRICPADLPVSQTRGFSHKNAGGRHHKLCIFLVLVRSNSFSLIGREGWEIWSQKKRISQLGMVDFETPRPH